MKSAYELAMERLEKQSPTARLTAEQKARIAEVDQAAKAKVAEKEVFLRDQMGKAQAQGKFDEVLQIEQQLVRELKRIQDDAEAKKEKIRRGE